VPKEAEDQELNEEEIESTDDDSGVSGEEEGGATAKEADEPFLAIDERNVYKTREAAIKGFGDTKAALQEERRKREAAEEAAKRFRRAILDGDDDSAKPKRKIDQLSEDGKRKWLDGKPIMEELLDDRYLTREELDRRDQVRFEAKTYRAMDKILEPAGIELQKHQKNRLKSYAIAAIQDKDDPLGEKLVEALNADDPDQFAKLVIAEVMGEEAANGKQRPRDAKGKFVSQEDREKAARLEKAGKNAATHPKAPPDGSGVGTVGTEKTKLPALKSGSRSKLFAEALQRVRGAG